VVQVEGTNTLYPLLSQSAHLLHPDAAKPLPPNDHHDTHAAITPTTPLLSFRGASISTPTNIHFKRKIVKLCFTQKTKNDYELPTP